MAVNWPPAEWPQTWMFSGSPLCSRPWRRSQMIAARVWRTISSRVTAGHRE